MYTRCQIIWAIFFANKNIQHENNDLMLLIFLKAWMESILVNMLQIIYSCIQNAGFVLDRFDLNKVLPCLKKYIKEKSKTMVKKLAIFMPKEFHYVLLNLQDHNTLANSLYCFKIDLLHYRLLYANKVREQEESNTVMMANDK